jgi:phosphoribosylpyrophosphate synthetase
MKIKKYQERLTNLQNAFAINSVTNRLPFFTWTPSVQVTQAILAGKTILLIDDIATTGATLFECAKILKQNGAKKVFGAVIARQEMK